MRRWKRFLSEVLFTERLPRSELERYVSRRLLVMLAHAASTVPYYQRRGELLNLVEAPGADAFDVLRRFPVVTKADVLEDPEAFRSRASDLGPLVKAVTSGTTGTPFELWMTRDAFDAGDALWWRRNVWSGYRDGEWIARLVGDSAVPLSDPTPAKPWRVSWTDRRIYMSTYHMNRETASLFLDMLESRRPEYLMGYPSSLEILAGFCEYEGRTLEWQPKAVWFSSEPMYEHQRDIVGRVFGERIVGLFGSAERIVSASQCEEGSYHLSAVDGFVEGQFGRLEIHDPARVTTLLNPAMPLVRFELGDAITPMPAYQCACGRTLPVIDPVITRQIDYLETPSGRRVTGVALTWAVRDLVGIRRTQIIQVSENTVEVHIDADEGVVEQQGRRLADRLRKMTFGELQIACLQDTSIEMTSSGKTRFVVNRLKERRESSSAGRENT
jgi:phenylacetate-CoA ligase